ncbi:MAG: helix-turn-helix transcriptional regulator [Sphingomonadales bacterium]|nr:helix-turn-helix transcriptional regulator [Sphingomonadales bacterium]
MTGRDGSPFAGLVTALVDGAFETPLWHTFLDRLRHATCAEFAILVFQPPGWPFDEAMQLMAGGASESESKRMFRRHFYPDKDLSRSLLDETRPYSLAELRAIDGDAHAGFFAELVDGHGISAIREMRVTEASGVSAWLTIARRGPDFGPADSAVMVEIAPVLRGMLRHFVAREQDRFKASLAAHAVGRLQFGWIALDAGGIVLDCDAFGDSVLTGSGVLYRAVNGRLAARSQEREREIGKAIASLVATPAGRPRALSLRADPWLDMLLVPVRDRFLTTAPTASVVAYVHGDNWGSSERAGQLTDLFGLNVRESRLALALCRGRTIVEAAVETGITTETARSYTKAIYAKTGARGLPDLVRIVMGSVLAIAAEH